MFTNRLFRMFVAVVLVFVLLLALQPFAEALVASNADHSYSQSKEQSLLEYQRGERYGELPQSPARFTVEQTLREYHLGERYGESPQDPAREYRLGERYGETPLVSDREYLLGERYGVTP